jgi:hypothetical protein
MKSSIIQSFFSAILTFTSATAAQQFTSGTCDPFDSTLCEICPGDSVKCARVRISILLGMARILGQRPKRLEYPDICPSMSHNHRYSFVQLRRSRNTFPHL